MKKTNLVVLALALAVMLAVTACAPAAPATPATTPAAPAPAAPAAATAAPAAEPAAPAEPAPAEPASGPLYIPVVSKGFQHQFWQVVMAGSQQAAKDLGVEINFVGPEGESAINDQVNMLKAEMTKNPSAIALAALDTQSIINELNECVGKKIPVIGFDSGVPEAPEGSIYANASTDNYAAASTAATEMMKDADFIAKITAATEDAPVRIGCLTQDATSASSTDRSRGFIDAMVTACEAIHPGAVAVEGHSNFAKASANPAKVIVYDLIPPSADATDTKSGAQTLLGLENIIGLFCVNEGTVNGLLSATNDGSDLDREKGKYKDLLVAGYDAGATQKNAVRNRWFCGSITQDPFQIGYQAVALAKDAAEGKPVSDVDTGCKWYTADNMDEPDIAQLLYD